MFFSIPSDAINRYSFMATNREHEVSFSNQLVAISQDNIGKHFLFFLQKVPGRILDFHYNDFFLIQLIALPL